VVRPDEEVKKEPPKIEEMVDKDPGLKTMEAKEGGQRAPEQKEEAPPPPPKKIVEEAPPPPKAEPPPPAEPLKFAEQMPQFPGGDKELYKWLSEHIKYPSIARENDIQGKVIVSFVVEENGTVSGVKVARGVHPSLDEEAVRVAKEMPAWAAGKQNGRAVRVSYNIPIIFKLE
jgi:protein TonB